MPNYQISEREDSRALRDFLSQEGQVLLPFLDSIMQTEQALDEVMERAGRATLEAILTLSAQQVAGAKHPGKKGSGIRWHGRQAGVVSLAERQLRVSRPRLRRKGGGRGAEVEIPVYPAMQSPGRLSRRMWEILMLGLSSRKYREVLPQMAEAVGVSKSEVSRNFIEASAEVLEELMERRFDELDILVVYVDGIVFGEHQAVAAIGVDSSGKKHVLGVQEGASENQVVAKALLEDLVARGLNPERRRLFVIDGSKALRVAIDAVFGSKQLVQRCRKHKERNVAGYLPEELQEQVQSVMRAAWQLKPEEGIRRVEQQAKWLDNEYPSAAASLREGLEEMFTINRLGLPESLRRCLGSTNVIESCFSGTRSRTRRVTHWQDGSMALRWAASALVATEKRFRRIMGYEYLWVLRAHLDQEATSSGVLPKRAKAR